MPGTKTDDATLKLVLQEGEGYKTEFKEGLSDMEKDMVAFSNSSGGTIFLGISDKNLVTGFEYTNRSYTQIMDLGRSIDPPIIPVVTRLSSNVASVYIPPGGMKPYRCTNGFYIRIGPISQKLKTREIVEMIMTSNVHLFGEMTNTSFKYPDDFSQKIFIDFCMRAGIPLAEDPVPLLKNLGFADVHNKEVMLNHSGVLLFGSDPHRFFRNSEVTCVRFKGIDRVDVLDRKDFTGTLIENYDNAVAFVKRNTRLSYKIEGLLREEISEYPDKVVREVIANAMIHRDYMDKTMVIQINVFDDRLEVVNPGGLMGGMTVEDLGVLALHRNPLLADAFFRMHIIEKIGSGIKRMRENMALVGGKPPQFKVLEKVFMTTIPSTMYGKSVQVGEQVTGPVKKQELADKSGPSEGRVGAESILLSLKDQPLSMSEIARRMEKRSVTGAMKRLVKNALENGLIEYTLPDHPNSRLQKYRLTEKGRKALEDMKRA